jgi:quercetin dioxygenase-like cupin family protein
MRRLFVTLAAMGMVVSLLIVESPADQPPIAAEELTQGARGAFTDDVQMQIRYTLDQRTRVLNLREPSRVAALRIVVQPGATFPWHTHPGPVIVTVAQGRLTYIRADDCIERVYPAGTSFIDPGRGNVHTARGWQQGETILISTLFETPATGPLTIPVSDPGFDPC